MEIARQKTSDGPWANFLSYALWLDTKHTTRKLGMPVWEKAKLNVDHWLNAIGTMLIHIFVNGTVQKFWGLQDIPSDPIYRTKESEKMTQFDIKELQFHLGSLFLCCGSVMAGAVEAMVRSYRFKFALEVTGKSNPDYNLFVEIARKLGVQIIQTDVKPDDPMRCYAWISDQSTKNQRAWVPGMAQREGDLHVMLPFYLKYHLSQLRKSDPSFPAPKVDSLYIMLIWTQCFGPWATSVSTRVLKDMVAWEEVGHLSAHRYLGAANDEIRTVHRKVWELSDLAQLYLGFCSGAGCRELTKGHELGQHPFNLRSSEWAATMLPGSGGTGKPLPHLVKLCSWDLPDIAIITKNVWVLHTRGIELCKNDMERVRQCLVSRLSGKSEDQIQGELGFESQVEYYKWQVSRAIDIDCRRLSDPLENWRKACGYFEIEPTLEALASFQAFKPDYSGQAGGPMHSALRGSNPAATAVEDAEPAAGPVSHNASVECAFRHSPDFRSVVATSGQAFILTTKQARVVEILHSAWQNGTPEVSHGHIIQEVYGEVAENRLKRLFAYDDAWGCLFEHGQGKGLIRLRMGPQQESQ